MSENQPAISPVNLQANASGIQRKLPDMACASIILEHK